MKQLKQKIEQLINNEDGNWSIVFEDLDKSERLDVNGGKSYYAASVIKLPIMATAFSMADKGLLKLSDMIEIKKEDFVGGAGVLQHLSSGLKLSIYDLIMLMIIQSDNTATNMIIEQVGKKRIQDTMEHIGMVHSSFYNKLMTVPVELEGRNMITANDVSTFLSRIVKGKFSSHYACEHMIDIMKRQQIHYLAACFPESDQAHLGAQPEWMMASKTGNIIGTYHDVGILYVGDRTVTITVLSDGNARDKALHILSEIGKAAYRYVTCT